MKAPAPPPAAASSPLSHLLVAAASVAVLVLALTVAAAPATAAPPNEASPPAPVGLEKATFAGGCFWCMEEPFDALPGVVSVLPGYIGGSREHPSYEEVSSGGTGHTEAVEVLYDPKLVAYDRLLHVFWRNIDPLVENRQFCDVGEQYRTGIFFHDEAQRAAAEASRREVSTRLSAPVRTEITAAGTFWIAEEYHRQYYKKNPVRYSFYRRGCGRDARLEKIWGDEARGGHPAAH